MNRCPICGSVFDNTDGVIMHLLNKPDDQHSHITSKYEAAMAIQGSVGVTDTLKVGQNSQTEDNQPEQKASKEAPSVETESSELFDEPEVAGLEADSVTLPCGHESVNPEEIPKGKNVTCTVCGKTHGVRK